MYYHEEKMDLLKVPRGYAIAHCISADFALGAGVAKQINDVYEMRRQLRCLYAAYDDWDTSDWVGACLLCMDVMTLVTKERYFHKPTLETLRSALEDMKKVCEEYRIHKVAMPQIGCGLDRLNWNDVKPMIQSVFADTDIEIMVCFL